MSKRARPTHRKSERKPVKKTFTKANGTGVRYLEKIVDWDDARERAIDLGSNQKTVVVVYRRAETKGGQELFFWRQDLQGNGEKNGRLPKGKNTGYELFRVSKKLVDEEDDSDDLRRAVMEAYESQAPDEDDGDGGGGPVSDAGPR